MAEVAKHIVLSFWRVSFFGIGAPSHLPTHVTKSGCGVITRYIVYIVVAQYCTAVC